MIAFFVPGKPATAGSKRAFVYTPKGGGKPRAVVVDANEKERTTKAWRTDVQAAALVAREDAGWASPVAHGPLVLVVTFFLPRPSAHYGAGGKLKPWAASALPTPRPDASKMLRCLEDALTGVLWNDDAQITSHVTRKRYNDGRGVGAEVRVGPDFLFLRVPQPPGMPGTATALTLAGADGSAAAPAR